MRDNTTHYRDLFLNDVPMMDARAPVEFAKGAFPGVLNLPLIGLWVRLLTIPKPWLYAGILLFATLGTIGANPSVFELGMLLAFGLMGYAMRVFGYPIAPVVVGLILGPLAEQQLRRAGPGFFHAPATPALARALPCRPEPRHRPPAGAGQHMAAVRRRPAALQRQCPAPGRRPIGQRL